MRHIGLFEGIGGFSLAARWMEYETIAWCEINDFCQKVLRHHFPKAKEHHDIKTTDFTIYRGKCDILTGGFPCQPYSAAGKRKGKEDERHLWPEMLRAVREISPRWVVGENVRGLTNWDGGLVFDEVQADLEAIGYQVLPFLLPACAVDAPHRRDRIWFIAYTESGEGNLSEKFKRKGVIYANGTCCKRITSNSDDERLQGSEKFRGAAIFEKKVNKQFARLFPPTWEKFPAQPPVCGGDDGLPRELDSITFSRWKNESIKAYGNAIVPQVALQIFKAIDQYERAFHHL